MARRPPRPSLDRQALAHPAGRFAADVAARLQFPAGIAWEPEDVTADYWQYHVLNCRGMSLGGGTDEIQRNTLGERVLGLPKEPVLDADVPFRDVLRNRAASGS